MIRLIVLGILLDKPIHGYGIQQILKDGRYDLWANILPNSIYNALRKMERDGIARINGSEKNGNQTRYIYEITEKGRIEFKGLLKLSISRYRRQFPSDLYIGLGYISTLPQNEIADALEQYSCSLRRELELWESGEKKKAVDTMAEPMKALFNNGKSHIQADLDFIKYIIMNLNSIKDILDELRG